MAREIHSPARARAPEVGYKQGVREIVLDTETTGLDPLAGHRVVELGCVELDNTMATGNTFHFYFNPEMAMPTGAQDIHGLSDEFLSDKPLFADKAEEFLAFIADAQLVIHNAQFDIGFLNAELERLGRSKLANPYIDTVSMARRKFPGQRASLDALCERFSIDNSSRTKHGALLDAELLAEVYLELSGGRQRDLGLAAEMVVQAVTGALAATGLPVRPPRPHAASAAELAAHEQFLNQLTEPLWLRG
jgi:DNA polymerase III subunit epsilon